MEIIELKATPWQYPAITEKFAFEKIKEEDLFDGLHLTYYAIPWATLIDFYNKESKEKCTLKKYLESFEIETPRNEESFTVIQTYHFRSFLDYFKSIGLTKLFCSHAVKGEFQDLKEAYGIEVHPFPLFAVNKGRPVVEKDLLYSFIGVTKYNGYSPENKRVSELRQSIFNLEHPNNTLIKDRAKWHFQDVVYKKQIYGGTLSESELTTAEHNRKEYINVLERSRFSLCPRGIGPNSIRLWESLSAGAIPICIGDDLWLPEDIWDWDNTIVRIKESNLTSLPNVLQELTPEKENDMRTNSIKAFDFFSGNNFTSTITDHYKTLL